MGRMRKMNDKGFTLVEIMLSIAILALISVPLMKYFSDSLRYAVQTEEKQKATLIAQETMETIRAQQKIVQEVSAVSPSPGATLGPTTYRLAPELTTMFGGYAGAVETPNVVVPANFVSTGATGTDTAPEKLIYRYVDQRSEKYYIETSFFCTTDYASVSSPAILSIDDRRNVVVAEREEESDAITFFKTANLNNYLAATGAVITDPSASPSSDPEGLIYITPDPGPTITPGPEARLLEEDEIRAQMKRIIYITVTKHTGDTNFKVNANYVYFCDDTFGNGDPAGKLTRVSPDLVETSVERLEGIYLMFNKLTPDGDDIQITWDVDGAADFPDLRFIVQDDVAPAPTASPSASPTTGPTTTPTTAPTTDPGTEYNLRVSLMNMTSSGITIHSNLDHINFYNLNLVDGGLERPEELVTKGTPRTDLTVLPLSGDGMPVRIFDVEVKVYKDKAAYTAGKDPLISLKTTKVE